MAFMRFNLTAQSTPTSIAIPFPNLHPVINPLHLDAENGKLLSDAEILQAEKSLENKHAFSYSIHSNSCNTKLKVFKINGWLYARYLGMKQFASLGDGCSGNVRIVQDLITGEFLAIKKQKIFIQVAAKKSQEMDEYFLKNETRFLEELKLSHGTYVRKRDKANIYYTVMPLVPGLTLDLFLQKKINKLTPSRYLLLMRNISLACKALQTEKMVHGDLKPSNIMVNDSYHTTLIDYQTITSINHGHTYLMNAGGYRAFEMFVCNTAPYPYTPATDMNALGITFAGIIKSTKESNVVDKRYAKNQWYRVTPRVTGWKNPIISDDRLCDTLINYFFKMTDNDPQQRPTIDDAVNFFQMQYEAIADQGKILKIGIIDLNEFNAILELNKKYAENLTLSSNQSLSYAKQREHSSQAAIIKGQLSIETKNLFSALKNMDTIYFIDRTKRADRDYQLISKLCSNNGLPPCEKIFKPNYLTSTTTGIVHSITQEHPWTNQDFKPAYFYITYKKLSSAIENFLASNSTCMISLDDETRGTANEIIAAHVKACLEQLQPTQSVQLTA